MLNIREKLGHRADPAGSGVVYCDTEGERFFDEARNPYVEAIVHILNERSREDWQLVQVASREADFICIWRRGL